MLPDRHMTDCVHSYSSSDWHNESYIPLETKASTAACLTHAFMYGKNAAWPLHESTTSLSQQATVGRADSPVDNRKKVPAQKLNIRATLGFWKLLWFDFKNWYRRWKVKNEEPIFLKSYIKTMESHFGSAIGSLFIFTRWMMFLNLLLSILWVVFVVLPTATNFSYSDISGEFAFKNLFDGKGVIAQSWLFFGAYPSKLAGGYHMGLAYLLLLLFTYFGSLFIILGKFLIGGGCLAIVYLVVYVNFEKVIPNQLPKMELYASGRDEMNITLTRIFFLRMANLFALITSLYNTISSETVGCTGTVIGQEMYKIVIMDTMMHSGVKLSMEFTTYFWKREKAEFNISSEVLVLIYRQALIWVGTIACPLMPLVGLLSNLIFFYVNYTIVSRTCKPPIKRWNQSRNTAFFSSFLLGSLALLIPPMSIVIGSSSPVNMGLTEVPGMSCGPFGHDKPTRAYTRFWMEQPGWLRNCLHYLTTEPVLIPVFMVLMCLMVHHRSRISNEQRQSSILHEELVLEREENEKLLKKLQRLGVGMDHH